MIRIILASTNQGKLREIRTILQGLPLELVSLEDYPDVPAVAEDGGTFLENALKKARTVSEWTGEIALSDDSGLEVQCLGGHPGIHSSRYSGEGATDDSNIDKLLKEMRNVPEEKRGAAFVCVLLLHFPDGRRESFEGRWNGRIHDCRLGHGGFGYDPVFFLPESGLTVAQLSANEKNGISHRARALDKLKRFLVQELQHRCDLSVRGDII